MRAGLCAVGLCLPWVADGSTDVNICREPAQQSHLTVAYHDQEESSLGRGAGVTDRVDFATDVLFASGGKWEFGFGHRSVILNVDELALQTNGYLHTFFFPIHRTSQSDGSGFRISFAPVLSGSSNVVKDPGGYSKDALQLLAAMVWSKRVSDRLDLSYGLCGDHRLGGYQVYPVISLEWRPHPDWTVELGFPASQLSYQITTRLDSVLRVSPNGNEWYVRNKSLEKSSELIYDAYVLEWAFNWRLYEHVMITASIGSEFDGRYEATLADDRRVRLSSDTATRLGVALAWLF